MRLHLVFFTTLLLVTNVSACSIDQQFAQAMKEVYKDPDFFNKLVSAAINNDLELFDSVKVYDVTPVMEEKRNIQKGTHPKNVRPKYDKVKNLLMFLNTPKASKLEVVSYQEKKLDFIEFIRNMCGFCLDYKIPPTYLSDSEKCDAIWYLMDAEERTFYVSLCYALILNYMNLMNAYFYSAEINGKDKFFIYSSGQIYEKIKKLLLPYPLKCTDEELSQVLTLTISDLIPSDSPTKNPLVLFTFVNGTGLQHDLFYRVVNLLQKTFKRPIYRYCAFFLLRLAFFVKQN